MKSLKLPRSRIQRTFVKWLTASQNRLAFPLRIIRRTDRWISMELVGVNSVISISLTSLGINIGVIWQGELWDLLIDFDVDLLKISGGYVCDLCIDEPRKIFPSRENLWRDHLFEPFLEWINNDLANAEVVGIYGTGGGGTTWATLTVNEGPPSKDEQALLPVRMRRSQ